jgi:hypothetical protein
MAVRTGLHRDEERGGGSGGEAIQETERGIETSATLSFPMSGCDWQVIDWAPGLLMETEAAMGVDGVCGLLDLQFGPEQ